MSPMGARLVTLLPAASALAAVLGGCRSPSARLVFQTSEDLSVVDSARLSFFDRSARDASPDRASGRVASISRSRLPPSLDLVLPEDMTSVAIDVAACRGPDLFLEETGGTYRVERTITIVLRPPLAPLPCRASDDAGMSTDPPPADHDQNDAGDGAELGLTIAPKGDGGGDADGACDAQGTDGVVCPDLAGTPDAAVPTPFTPPPPACVDYCGRMSGLCPAVYDDEDQCLRYCGLVAWPAGTAFVPDDTFACRNDQLDVAARVASDARSQICLAAGPSGGRVLTCGSAACGNYCNAWSRICATTSGAFEDCKTSCEAHMAAHPGAAEPVCRYPALARAARDLRYCDLAALGAPCVDCSSP